MKPLPRVYSPGTLTKTETNRTIHHAIVTSVRKIPGISADFGGLITYISKRTDYNKVVGRWLDFSLDVLAEKSCSFGHDIVMFVPWQRTFVRCSGFSTLSGFRITLTLEPRSHLKEASINVFSVGK